MKRMGFFTVILCSLGLLAGCGQNVQPQAPGNTQSQAGVQKISAQQAKEKMDAGGVRVVDVRRQDEFDAAHIPGSVLVPLDTIGSEPPAALPDKDAALLVYCRSGVRSAQASAKLAALGYTKVYDFGGIIDWPYETEAGVAQP